MKRIILCEGKTDAILISYFLITKFGWGHINNNAVLRRLVTLPVDKENEVLNWYNHPDKENQELSIWGVGGISQIPAKLEIVIDRNQNERREENRFERLVVFFDSDNRDGADCIALVREWAEGSGITLTTPIELGEWAEATIELNVTPPETYAIQLLPIVIPPSSRGALETFLMDCIGSQTPEDEQLVTASREFITSLPDEPYLAEHRNRPKATLGAILSVISPDWVFSVLDERIRRVGWEEIELALNAYGKLDEL